MNIQLNNNILADIAMCSGNGCPMMEQCYRHTAKFNEYGQSYFMNPPIDDDGSCEYFWDNKEYPPEGVFHIKTENS